MEAVPQNRKHYIQVRSPLCRDRLCAVVPLEHPLAACTHVTIEKLLEYPLIIETPGCDNDILHLLNECAVRPNIVHRHCWNIWRQKDIKVIRKR